MLQNSFVGNVYIPNAPWSLAFSACQRSRKATLLAMLHCTVRDFKAIFEFGDEPPRMIWPDSRCHIKKETFIFRTFPNTMFK